MKLQTPIRILTIGFGCISAVVGYTVMTLREQEVLTSIINNNPTTFIMVYVGFVAVGMALGAEQSD